MARARNDNRIGAAPAPTSIKTASRGPCQAHADDPEDARRANQRGGGARSRRFRLLLPPKLSSIPMALGPYSVCCLIIVLPAWPPPRPLAPCPAAGPFWLVPRRPSTRLLLRGTDAQGECAGTLGEWFGVQVRTIINGGGCADGWFVPGLAPVSPLPFDRPESALSVSFGAWCGFGRLCFFSCHPPSIKNQFVHPPAPPRPALQVHTAGWRDDHRPGTCSHKVSGTNHSSKGGKCMQ